MSKTIDNRYLSAQCGEHYSRCEDLLVMTRRLNETVTLHTVPVPVVDGILLVNLKHTGTRLSYSSDHIIDIPYACSPTTFVEMLGYIYTVCLNLESLYVTVLEIHLNATALENSWVSPSLIRFYELDDPPRLSDFEYVYLSKAPESQLIVFSTASYVYAFVPLSFQYFDVGDLGNCDAAERLEYGGDGTLLAYCKDNSVVYFDLSSEDWINQTVYEDDGLPFVCPNPDIHLAVYPYSYIQYGVWSQNSKQNFNIPGMKFSSGVCFGPKNNTLFAYVDKESGVYVLDADTSTLHELTSKACWNSCEPLMVFDERYVVIHEIQSSGDTNILVIDSQEDFSKIIEGQHTQADLLTLINDVDLVCDTQRIPDVVITKKENSKPGSSTKSRNITIIGVFIGVVGVVILAIIGIVPVICIWKR